MDNGEEHFLVHEPTVCACVVNFNTAEDTIACLESLTSGNLIPTTLVVIDNGSSDGSPDRIASWALNRFGKDSVLVLAKWPAKHPQHNAHIRFALGCAARNDGFAAGANRAIELAAYIGRFDFMWFLNSDTVASPNALRALVRYAVAEPSKGIIGSTVVHADKPDIVESAGGCTYNKWTTIFRPVFGERSLADVIANEEEMRLDYVYGASMFVRSSMLEICGPFNEEYFLFYEELDLCKRVIAAGFKLGWCKESIVQHKGSASLRKLAEKERKQRAFANYHENLSTLIYTRRNCPRALIVAGIARLVGKGVVLAGRSEWYLIKPLVLAYFDFLRGINRRSELR